MTKFVMGLISLSLFALMITYASSQEEEVAVVSLEMFAVLQQEIGDLYSRVGNLQDQLQTLAESLQNLASNTAAVGSVELAELQALIDVSNRQDQDIAKLYYFNGLWQQNFRVINSTFEKLRKVVVFPIPTLNNPTGSITAVARKILPVIQKRPNITVVQTSKQKPSKPMLS